MNCDCCDTGSTEIYATQLACPDVSLTNSCHAFPVAARIEVFDIQRSAIAIRLGRFEELCSQSDLRIMARTNAQNEFNNTAV